MGTERSVSRIPDSASRSSPRSASPAPAPESASPISATTARLTQGRPLPPTTRERMEHAYGTGMGHVRVHTDATATELTQSTGAEAATVGPHIAFAPGMFRPGTPRGDHLIAHEVGHVVQQGGQPGPPRMRLGHSQPGDPAEQEAELAADRAVQGQRAGITPGRLISTRDRIMRRARPGAAPPPTPTPRRARRQEEPAAPARPAPAAPGAAAAGPAPAPAPAASAPAPEAPVSAAAPALEVTPEPRPGLEPPAPAGAEAAAPAEEAAPEEAAPEEAEAAGGGGLVVEPLMPPPPEALGPEAQARLEAAEAAAGRAARAESDLPGADTNTSEARAAVTEPEEQLHAEAGGDLVTALDTRPPPSPEIEELCQRIYQAIRDKRPPDEDSLVDSNPEEAAQEAGQQLDTTLQRDTERVGNEYDALDEGAQPRAAVEGTEPERPPESVDTPALHAEGAAPDPVPAENVSLEADVESSSQQMDEAGMMSEPAQLVQEGPIAEARSAHGELEQTAAEDPAQVLAEQQAAIASAQADMAALQARALEALNSSRRDSIEGAATQQVDMAGSEEQMRASVGAQAQAIFSDAQTQVRALLEPLPRTAMQRWEAGLPALSRAFRTELDDVKRRIEERHSGVGGAILGAVDYVTGLPDWVVRRYDAAEATFGDGVCNLVRDISRDVNAVVAAAEALIADARRRIDELFAQLPEELQTWADEQRGQFAERLDGLTAEVHQARDGFNRDLAGRAAGAVQEVREEIHALRQAAGGLLGRIAAAIGAFLDDPFRFIINGLLSLVGIPPASFWRLVDRLGEVIEGIADDPVGFANNLLEAVKQGFQRFFDNIADHLLQGLLTWLFSGLGSVGVELPTDLSLRSVVTFFLQLMGLTWANIRVILARHIGEENVALLEQAYTLISTLIEQGPQGIFEMIKEQLNPATILERVMDAAIDMVIDALITRVALRIVAMLNPAGAILAAIEAIYRIIRWVFENAARIFTLIETIVNGAHDLMNGNVGGMAAAIEGALARLIPPVIDFLAGFLGLGDLPERIADVIRGLQQWVLGIVDRVVGFIAGQARRLLAALGIGGEEGQPGAAEGVIEKDFSAQDGKPHELTVALAGAQPDIKVASNTPTGVQHQISDRRNAATSGEPPRPLTPAQDAALTDAWNLHDQLVDKARDFKAATPEQQPNIRTQIQALMDQLAAKMVAGDAWKSTEIPPTNVTFSGGGGLKQVVANPLSQRPGNTVGSAAADVLPGWRTNVPTQTAGRGGTLTWRRVHLLSDRLHGPGNEPANLIPGDETTNGDMRRGPERLAYERIQKGETLEYTARVTGLDPNNNFFPASPQGVHVSVNRISPEPREPVFDGPIRTRAAPTPSGGPQLTPSQLSVVSAYETLRQSLGRKPTQIEVATSLGMKSQGGISTTISQIRELITAAPRPLTAELDRAATALGF